MVFLEDGDVAVLRPDSVAFYDREGTGVDRDVVEIEWSAEAAERGGFEHFMRKEIAEQPETIERIASGRIVFDRQGLRRAELSELDRFLDEGGVPSRVAAASCGTSHHASLVAKWYLERLAGIATDVYIASEFRYEEPLLAQTDAFLSISQSGETADTLASLDLARETSLRSLAICNVIGSRLCREADATILTQAGPEVGVASTKAFSSQVVAALLVAIEFGLRRGTVRPEKADRILAGLEQLPRDIRAVLESEHHIRAIAQKHAHARAFLFLGRGLQVPVAMEGALKLKEISYTPAEGLAAGEIKHGPIALVDPQVTSVFLATPSGTHRKLMANMSAIAARKGPVVAVAVEGTRSLAGVAEDVLTVPHVVEELQPLVNTVALQLFSYHVAHALGREIDKPRNLAKSVTVE